MGPRKVRKNVVYESLPEVDCPDKGFPYGFLVKVHEEVGVWRDSLGSHGFADKLEKIPVHE